MYKFIFVDYIFYVIVNIIVNYYISFTNFKYPVRIENSYNINLIKKLNPYDYLKLNISKYIFLYLHNWFFIIQNNLSYNQSINIISIASYFIIQDFLFYGYHRLMHTNYLYIKFHKKHHEHIIPNSTSYNYSHIIDENIKNISLILPIFIIQFNRDTIYLLLIITQIWDIIIHESKFRFKVKYINTPGNHLVHHMYKNNTYNCGYWTIIPDIIFRTYYEN